MILARAMIINIYNIIEDIRNRKIDMNLISINIVCDNYAIVKKINFFFDFFRQGVFARL